MTAWEDSFQHGPEPHFVEIMILNNSSIDFEFMQLSMQFDALDYNWYASGNDKKVKYVTVSVYFLLVPQFFFFVYRMMSFLRLYKQE